jgi:hypothetical protein
MSLKRKPPDGNVRRVRSNRHNLCGVITNKAGRLVQFESWLERALILRLDRDPEVLDYQSQPESFEFIDEHGQQRSYTPDFKVWRRDGTIEIHEVTLSQRRVRSNIRRRERAGRKLCQERGWHYVVHTEQSLPGGSELANLLALGGYRPPSYANQAVTQAAYGYLAVGQSLGLKELVGQIKQALNLPEGQVTAGLCHLLWHGELATDLNQLLFDQSAIVPGVRVWMVSKEGNDGSPIA